MNRGNNILNYQEKTYELIKQKILALSAKEKKSLALSGTVQEKTILASIGCYIDILSKDVNPEVRKEVVKYADNYTNFANDPCASVRHAVVIRLKNEFEQNVPEIKLDKMGAPYVVNTPKRCLLKEMTGDLSAAVSITAKETLANLQRKELKEAINVVLNGGGLKDVACLLGNVLENSLNRGLLANDIDELPVRYTAIENGKAGIDR